MRSATFAFVATVVALFFTGCSHLDTTPPGEADRVITGVISAGADIDLPAGSEIWVRVIDFSRGEDKGEVLGEQTIKNPEKLPAPFKIEYRAEDPVLRGSVAVDARVSVGGHLRYLTAHRHPVTLGNVNDPHEVEVQPATNP